MNIAEIFHISSEEDRVFYKLAMDGIFMYPEDVRQDLIEPLTYEEFVIERLNSVKSFMIPNFSQEINAPCDYVIVPIKILRKIMNKISMHYGVQEYFKNEIFMFDSPHARQGLSALAFPAPPLSWFYENIVV